MADFLGDLLNVMGQRELIEVTQNGNDFPPGAY